MAHKVGNGAILGITSEDGVASQKRVVLMDRTNMQVVKQTIADEYGAYLFNGLNPDSNDYIIFSVDDDGNPKKQSIIYDYVQPIPAHQGGFFWGNWYRIAMLKEPCVMFIGVTEKSEPSEVVFPYGVGSGAAYVEGSIVEEDSPPLMDGAANIPSTVLIGGSVAKEMLNHYNNLRNPPGSTKVSGEIVFDPSSIVSDVTASLYTKRHNYYTDSSNYASSFISIEYRPSTKTLYLKRHNGGVPSAAHGVSDQLVTVVSYNLTDEQQIAPIHVVGSIEYGVSAELYVNGSLVGSSSLLGTNLHAGRHIDRQTNTFGFFGGLGYGSGSRIYNQRADMSIGLFSFYADTITAGEVMDRYLALTQDVLPVVTGYMKSVVADYPLYFIRFDDLDESAFATDALRSNAIMSESVLYKAVASKIKHDSSTPMVAGGSGMTFSGGSLRGLYFDTVPMSRKFITFEFIAQPSKVTLSTHQTVFCHANNANTTIFELRISATGFWELIWREGGAQKTVPLSTVIDLDNKHHYAFSVDKLNLTATLYVDGEVAEIVEVTPMLFDLSHESTSSLSRFYIAGKANDTLDAVANPYMGYLSELAMYPALLSQDKIKAHYNARLVI